MTQNNLLHHALPFPPPLEHQTTPLNDRTNARVRNIVVPDSAVVAATGKRNHEARETARRPPLGGIGTPTGTCERGRRGVGAAVRRARGSAGETATTKTATAATAIEEGRVEGESYVFVLWWAERVGRQGLYPKAVLCADGCIFVGRFNPHMLYPLMAARLGEIV